MERLSTEKILEYLDHTQIRCSYKLVLLYIMTHLLKQQKKVDESDLAHSFISFYSLREKLNLISENLEKCNPLSSKNPKLVMETPLAIFERDSVVARIKEANNSMITFNYDYAPKILTVLEEKMIEYFERNCFDDPTEFLEFLKVWKTHQEDNFSQTTNQQDYEKIYLRLYKETFKFEKKTKNIIALMQVRYESTTGPVFVVLKGSQIDEIDNPDSNFNYSSDPSTASLFSLREKLKQSKQLTNVGSIWVLQNDLSFLSPSAASQFVAGTTSNGKVDWKLENGFRLKDFMIEFQAIPPKFLFLVKTLNKSGYGALMTFFIDKWANMTISNSSDQNPVNVQYFLDFYQEFNLPIHDDYKGFTNSRKYRFFNLFTNGFSSTDTLVDYRKPRNYGCVAGHQDRSNCKENECKYFTDSIHLCDRSKGLIWTTSSQSAKDYTFSRNYLSTINQDVLHGTPLNFSIVYEMFFFFREQLDNSTAQIKQFREIFHLSSQEFEKIFVNSSDSDVNEKLSDDSSQLKNSPKVDSHEIINSQNLTQDNSTIFPSYTFTKKFFDLDEAIFDSDQIDELHQLLINNKQLILYGPPGTGKTYLAQVVAETFSQDHYEIVQFHPSYSYEDFVEGIDANPSRDQKSVLYEPNPRIFRQLCSYAKEHPNENVVLIIDEINRGDLSRIFGELIMGLEPSYRGVLPIITPLSRYLGPLVIPSNLFIIGTMNSLDRSIAIVDYALRRRFLFYKISPDSSVLRKWQEKHSIDPSLQEKYLHQLVPSTIQKPEMRFYSVIQGIFESLNSRIRNSSFTENHQIGHTYFFVQSYDQFHIHWRYKIVPLLEEYTNFKSPQLKSFALSKILEGLYGDRS